MKRWFSLAIGVLLVTLYLRFFALPSPDPIGGLVNVWVHGCGPFFILVLIIIGLSSRADGTPEG